MNDSTPQTLPFGSWPSPVTTSLLVEGAASLTDVWGEGDAVWWSERRPQEAGRIQIVRRDPDGTTTDVLPEGFNARTRVHEYGGGAWWVARGVVYFTNWSDQRLYRVVPGSQPEAITPEPTVPAGWRYADGRVTPDGESIVCVREDHTGDGEAVNEIVSIAVDGSKEPTVLVTGRDFVAAPRPSPDGKQLAWIAWDHPSMPWDDTELWVAHMHAAGGQATIDRARRVAGGRDEAVMQPRWSRHGMLHVISDRKDMWNVYRVDGVDTLAPMLDADGEVGAPAWIFGLSAYGFTRPDGDLVATWSNDTGAVVGVVSHDEGSQATYQLPLKSLGFLRTNGDEAVAIAHTSTREPEVVRIRLESGGPDVDVLRPSRDLQLSDEDISVAQPIAFPSKEGRTAYALFYEPKNAEHVGPVDEQPPLVVMSHGGPTSAAQSSFNLGIQYWTTRGFAVVDVNYGGSTGYGRAYRNLLRGNWGVVDIEDCCAAAEFLANQGLVDGDRLVIRGGSAGGFTTLAALAFTDTFKAGANHYGVSDMVTLDDGTHKFESQYMVSMVGPRPEADDLFHERSPINHVDGFSVPLITFQGLDDQIVLPEQSERIVAALDAKGVPHAYMAFEGEQHGFRQAETIVAVADAELSFYGQVLGFDTPGVGEPVKIVHGESLEG
jgi:dipeptidyl aminopeptidase/acylaminoacyl peptidase